MTAFRLGEWTWLYEIRTVTITVRGKEFTRDVLEHPGSVAVLAQMGDDQFIFVRQHRAAVDRTTLELPGGRIRPGESPQEAAIREMEAETGIRPTGLHQLAIFYPAPGYSTEMCWCFLAEGMIPGSMQFDESEEMNVEFLSWPAVRQAMARGEIVDARTLITLYRWGELQAAALAAPNRTF